MRNAGMSRRSFLRVAGPGVAGALVSAGVLAEGAGAAGGGPDRGASCGPEATQRLSVEALDRWIALQYGMFIHFGMSTFLGEELPDGKAPAETYAPDRLDVRQWVAVARDAGMKYAVLTAKHVAGHCLWPSKLTDYTVAHSGNTLDVVERFVFACQEMGVLPGLYYCSWDNHNRFGSRTPSDGGDGGPPFTTSLYQDFQTAQVTELLTQYGAIQEMWIDIPWLLGRGYRTYLYDTIASLQPACVVMMNHGIWEDPAFKPENTWPTDLLSIERALPPETGHVRWRKIEGRTCYLPGEVCDPIGKEWFWKAGDGPRPDAELSALLQACRDRGANLLLDVPPDPHGVIPDEHVQALNRLRKAAGL